MKGNTGIVPNGTIATDRFDINQMISRLPQASILLDKDVNRWISLTEKYDLERMHWHVGRAGGIGGSEVGAINSWMNGTQSRGNASRIARQKLFKLPPDTSDENMKRGNKLEGHIRSFYEEYLNNQANLNGIKWTRRDDIVLQLNQANTRTRNTKYPWLRASLDAAYEVDGKIVFPDFKAPSEEALQSYLKDAQNVDGVLSDYKAQLNHYAMVAENSGINVDVLQLVLYDYKRAGTVGIHVLDIEYDLLLQQNLIDASQSFWNDYVLNGVIPDSERRPTIVPVGGIPAAIEHSAQTLVVTRMAKKQLEVTERDAMEEISTWVKNVGEVEGNKLPLGGFGGDGMINVTSKREINPELAIARLLELGVGMEEIENDCRKLPVYSSPDVVAKHYEGLLHIANLINQYTNHNEPIPMDLQSQLLKIKPLAKKTGPWSQELLANKLVSCDESPYKYMTETLRFALDTKSRPDMEERLEVVGVQVNGMVEYLSSPERGTELVVELPEVLEEPTF